MPATADAVLLREALPRAPLPRSAPVPKGPVQSGERSTKAELLLMNLLSEA